MRHENVCLNGQAMTTAEASPAGRALAPPRRRVLIESIAAAVCAYFLSAAFEAAVIRSLGPTEWELAWISDVALAGAFGTAVYLWRHLLTTRRELVERERAQLVVDTQLSVAADIQRLLLPPAPPGEFGFEWAAALRSAGTIGGDFYDFVRVNPSQLVVLIADVSGKGIPAAMALGSLRSAFHALARRSADPARIVMQLSAGLYDEWRGSLYVTCIVATFDLRVRVVTCTNAGHPPAIVTGRGGLRRLRRGGPPAGLFPQSTFERESIQLHTGDVCLLVTDGITESLDGDAALERDLERLPLRRGPGLAARVCELVMRRALAGDGPAGASDWDDDRTVVVATIGAAPASRGQFTGGSLGKGEGGSGKGNRAEDRNQYADCMREYDLIADWYAGDRSPSIGVREALAAVSSLPRGSRILDLGCGNGRPIADALVSAGYRVVGLDSSRAMLERFRGMLAGVPAVHADARACPFADAAFDAAISWGMLFHLAPRDQAETLSSVCRVLRPGAPFLFTAAEIADVPTDDPGITGTMNGVTFHYYAVPDYRALLAEHGFVLEDVYDDPGVSTYYFALRRPYII